jgi:hypothetical protein
MLVNVPLLNSQFQDVGLPPDWSVKFTVRGAQPETTLLVKLAVGFCPYAMPVTKKAITNTMKVFVRVV